LNEVYLEIQPQTRRGIPLQNRDPVNQVIESRHSILESHSESHWKFWKTEHENGL